MIQIGYFNVYSDDRFRPISAGHDWELCGDEYAINSDSLIVLSTVLAF